VVSHRAASHGIENFSLRGKSRWLLFYNPIFSAAQRTILATLSKGACLCLASRERLATSLIEIIQDMQIDALGITPSALALLPLSTVPSCLQQITTVGEPLGQQIVDDLADRVDLRVSYGLSECGQLNFSRQLRRGENPRIVGQPTDTTQAYILEPGTLRLLNVETRGELCLAGPQLADGYHKRPEQTNTSFIPNPFGNGRLYRTGDLAVRHRDGSVEILGRIDYQIKIHGQRLEPAEVTTVLSKVNDVKAITVVGATIKGKTALVAAVVPKDGVKWVGLMAKLRQKGQESLPSYMIPSFWLRLKVIPTNRSGKVNVTELRNVAENTSVESLLDQDVHLPSEADVPQNSFELATRDAWARVLNMEPSKIGRSSSFTDFGGSSLEAIQVVRNLRSQGFEVELGSILRSQKLSDIKSVEINNAIGDDSSYSTRFAFVKDEEVKKQLQDDEGVVDAYPPTQFQGSLLASTLQGNTDYLYQRTYDVRHLDVIKLKLAVQIVFSSSELLRTTYSSTSAGILQIVRNDFALPWKQTSMSLNKFKGEDKSEGFQFGRPFVRFTLLNKQLLVVSMHHSLFDFWSHHFLYEDVAKLYLGIDTVKRPPFRRFVGYLQKQDPLPANAFWKSYLEHSEPSLLTPCPLADNYHRSRHVAIDIKRVMRALGTTSSALVYTAWALLVSRHTGHSEATFATTIAGRELPLDGIDILDGPTLTIVPQRILVDPKTSLTRAAQQAHISFWDVLKHSQHGMRRALTSAGLQGNQLFNTFVNILIKDTDAERISDQVFLLHGPKPSWQTEWTTLDVEEDDKGFLFRLISPMPEQRIDFILDQLAAIFTKFVEEPNVPVGSIDILGADERKWLSSSTASIPAEPQRLHDRFEACVRKYPDNFALQWQKEKSITYRELEVLINQMSHFLLENGIRPRHLVPLLLEKSPTMIVAILAVLKVGAAYVPLSPENPLERNMFITQEIGAEVVITESTFQNYFPATAISSLLLDKVYLARYPESNLNIQIDPQDLAYVIYTSGSTGQPKGVMIEHKAVSAAIGSIISFEGREGFNWRSLQFSNYVFDVSVYDIFVALSSGHTLCLAPTDRLLSDLAGVINELEVNHCFLTPTVVRLLDPKSVPSLKVLAVGGEPLTSDVVENWSRDHRLINAYGPTETSILAAMKEITFNTNSRDIGPPLPTLQAFIIDVNEHHLVPYGAVGELCFSGVQLAAGYLNKPGQTATSFVDLDLGGVSRIYRTGDLARWLPNGDIECLGRKDNQIKINGFRVELGEIEQTFLKAECVKDAVVVVSEVNFKPQLVAYIVFMTESERTLPLEDLQKGVGTLRQGLKSLAHYMMPKYVIPLKAMPKLPSGKSNRKELKAMAGSMTVIELAQYTLDAPNNAGRRIPPETEKEKVVHEAWAHVLAIEGHQFGLEADFLNLGGDSIAAINLASRLRKEGYALSVGEALSFTNLKDMIDHIQKEQQEAAWEHKVFEPPAAIQEALTIQALQDKVESIYCCPPGQTEFLAQGARHEQYWAVMAVRQLPKSTDIDKWLQTARQLAQVNEILRTTFLAYEGAWYGAVLKDAVPVSTTVEISSEEGRRKAISKVWQCRFIFGRPFLSYTFMRHVADGTYEVVIKMDHGLYDGTLLRVFDDHFKALQNGQPVPTHTPFADFASHLYSMPKSPALKFWTSPRNRPTSFQYPKADNPCITATEILTAEHLNLDPFCKATSSTPSTVFQACFQLWLRARSGSSDVSFDYLYTGRNIDLRNPQSINGTCANFLPMRAQVNSNHSTKDYLSATQTAFWQATDNSVISFDEIYAANGLSRAENTNTALFLFQPFDLPSPVKEEYMRWLVMAKSEVTMPQPYAVVFEIVKLAVGWKLKLGYDRSVFEKGEAEKVVREIMGIVEGLVEGGVERKIGEVM